MNIDIQHRPGAAVAVCAMAAGESIRAEADAMISMAGPISAKTQARKGGGLLKGLKRSVLGGESFFTNEFTAQGPSELCLAPRLPGDMIVHPLAPDHQLFIQGGSYVAAPDSVHLDTKWQGFTRGLFSGESFFFLHATGQGPVILNAFGAISWADIDGELIVDTGHVVAFTNGLQYDITKASSGWIASLLSGEGFVLRFRGRGRVYLQTRNPTVFGQTIGPKLPPR